MDYLVFSFWFVLIHTFSYTLSGVLALKISGDLYQGEDRLLDFMRDMAEEDERKHVEKYSILVQLVRGFLMSIVLYPILEPLKGLSFGATFLFMMGLMLVFTDLASSGNYILKWLSIVSCSVY